VELQKPHTTLPIQTRTFAVKMDLYSGGDFLTYECARTMRASASATIRCGVVIIIRNGEHKKE